MSEREDRDARRLAQRMADKAAHPALVLRAAEILQTRGHPGDTLLAATLRCAADALPWRYGVVSPDVDDVMTGLVRTADEIVQQRARPSVGAPVQINMLPPREPDLGYGPGHLSAAYERGRRQGRYEAGR